MKAIAQNCFYNLKVYRKRHFPQIFSSSVHLTQERNFGEKFCPNAAGLRNTLLHSTWNIGRLITQTRSFFFQEFFVRLSYNRFKRMGKSMPCNVLHGLSAIRILKDTFCYGEYVAWQKDVFICNQDLLPMCCVSQCLDKVRIERYVTFPIAMFIYSD